MLTPSLAADRKSTRLNSSHTVIYTLSLHDALPILTCVRGPFAERLSRSAHHLCAAERVQVEDAHAQLGSRSEEHTSELQSHSDLHSFPTRRSSDLDLRARPIRRAPQS